MAETKGWAVVNDRDQIFVKTVSDTRRAALVNYLVTECRLFIKDWQTDGDIEQLWDAAATKNRVRCLEVLITTQRGN
jgi:hypothetical protein